MMTTPDALDFYVVYFPRSAGKYFTLNYRDITNTTGNHVHKMSYLENKNVLSIIRNPVDCITSTVVVSIFQNAKADKAMAIDFLIQQYLDSYQAILDSKSILVRFDDVVNRFELIVKELSTLFGHTIVNEFTDIRQKTTDSYLQTSRLHPSYDEIREAVSTHPLIDVCNEIYNKALSRCI